MRAGRGFLAPADAPHKDAAKPNQEPIINDHAALAEVSATCCNFSVGTFNTWLGRLTPSGCSI